MSEMYFVCDADGHFGVSSEVHAVLPTFDEALRWRGKRESLAVYVAPEAYVGEQIPGDVLRRMRRLDRLERLAPSTMVVPSNDRSQYWVLALDEKRSALPNLYSVERDGKTVGIPHKTHAAAERARKQYIARWLAAPNA